MSTMRFALSLLMIIFFQIIRISGKELGLVIASYKTVTIPPNNGSWVICSNHITDYVSYSVRVTFDLSASPDGTCGQTYPGLLSSTPNTDPGITTALLRHSNLNLFTSHQLDFAFVPSLSCAYSIVSSCDQDTGTIHIDQPDKYCLGVTNPTSVEQKVNVAVDFENTVFSKGGFTSPNEPGGNSIVWEDDDMNSFSDIIFENDDDSLGMQKEDIIGSDSDSLGTQKEDDIMTTMTSAASSVQIDGMVMRVLVVVVVVVAMVLGLL